jgi:pyridoxine 5-phosphate synthase
VNAGHDLNQRNLGTLKRAIPQLAEVSIGHALVGEALYEGLAVTVRNYLKVLGAPM